MPLVLRTPTIVEGYITLTFVMWECTLGHKLTPLSVTSAAFRPRRRPIPSPRQTVLTWQHFGVILIAFFLEWRYLLTVPRRVVASNWASLPPNLQLVVRNTPFPGQAPVFIRVAYERLGAFTFLFYRNLGRDRVPAKRAFKANDRANNNAPPPTRLHPQTNRCLVP